jgi:hypothetical protein
MSAARRPGTNHFRPTPKFEVNGYLIVAILGAFDLWLIGMVVVDAWRIWGPHG